MKREFIVEREGRSFVLYAGLLDEAHQQGLKSISTQLVQVPNDANNFTAICSAVVVTEKGTFSGIGDASPDNVTRIMRQHIIRMSETRAKARALRDAVNVGGLVSIEELGGDIEVDGPEGYPDPWAKDRRAEQPGTEPPAPGRTRTNGRTSVVRGDETAQAQGRALGVDQATPAQVNAIYAIAKREYRWTEEDVEREAQTRMHKSISEFLKGDASRFIDYLKTGQGPAGA